MPIDPSDSFVNSALASAIMHNVNMTVKDFSEKHDRLIDVEYRVTTDSPGTVGPASIMIMVIDEFHGTQSYAIAFKTIRDMKQNCDKLIRARVTSMLEDLINA